MEDKEILEFIQEVSKPLSALGYWKRASLVCINTYKIDIETKEIAFEHSLSRCLATNPAYANQLVDIKNKLNDIFQKAQKKRKNYERIARQIELELSNSSANPKFSSSKSILSTKKSLLGLKNTIHKFKMVLEPSIQNAITFVEEKEKKLAQKTITIIVDNASSPTPQSLDAKKVKVPHYRYVRYEKKYLGEIYRRIVDDGIIEDTAEDDFIYYFGGKSKPAINKLVNCGDLLCLAIFLKDCMLDEEEREVWKNTEAIFSNVKYNSIKNKYSTYNSHYSNNCKTPRSNKDKEEHRKKTVKYQDVLDRINRVLEDIPTK